MKPFYSVIDNVFEVKTENSVQVWAEMEDSSCIYLFDTHEHPEIPYDSLIGKTINQAKEMISD